MANLKVADFYYGSVLSMLFNAGLTPTLIESSEERRIYKFSVDSGDILLFIKYRTKPNKTKDPDYKSWSFSLTKEDRVKIKQFLNDKLLRLVLVLGMEKLNKSELAILEPEDIKLIIISEKESFTITRRKNERAFRLILNGSRKNSLKIPTNRNLI
ncbi:hypothetical protein [Thermosipho sp. 1244]|uniref:hypothetical protein n=1 Tax=Thermosipho sp. 1244 TaxID=1755816 RepID=UPI001BDF2210|nr:hypothetical protein [Thermosipho sp. 1244]MBT1248690.1 hypothetical protein [Thermosipho sp. 1244]